MVAKLRVLAWLVVLDGLRRYAIIGLVALALALEVGGLLFVDFIPRDIGRVASDFILSVGFFAGIIFLLFHAVQAIAWDEGRRTSHTFLARPITRSQYVLGVFLGLSLLLLLLNIVLAGTGYGILFLIKNSVKAIYFKHLSLYNYGLAWAGLYCSELIILAAVMVFSGLVRKSFPVLLMTVSYYCICSGLPVVRDAFIGREENDSDILVEMLRWLTAIFPDLGRFDFKTLITKEMTNSGLWQTLGIDFALLFFYLLISLTVAAMIYERRDLQ